jgi:hypothetical protein
MGKKPQIAFALLAVLGVAFAHACAKGRANEDRPDPPAAPDPPVTPPTPDPIDEVDAALPDPPPPGPTTVRFFLSGHSLTDDPMADDVVAIASSLGLTAEYEEQIVVGSPIRYRTKGPDPSAPGFPGYELGKNRDGSGMDVASELRDPQHITEGTDYDALVITERHDLPMAVRWENTVGYLRQFHDQLIAGNPAGKTYLFHSWLPIDKDAPEAWLAYEKAALHGWECVAAKVNLTLEAEGREDRVVVLPAGGALVALVEAVLAGEVPGVTGSSRERLDVFFSDDVHMTPFGKYFMGLVTVAALFERSPVGAEAPDDLGRVRATVARTQEIAGAYVADYLASARGAEPPSMPACRALFAEELCAPFHAIFEVEGAAQCMSVYADADDEQNPFRWPDPSFTPLPSP